MMKNKFGWVQIIFTYIFLWISIIFGEKNKDIFLISYLAAIICIVDAKFKYNSVFIKINYWIITVLFFVDFAILIL